MAPLTPEQVRSYREQGYVFPIRVLSRDEAARCRQGFEALDRAGDDDREAMVLKAKPHLLHPWLDALVRHPVLLDVIEQLIGPDILLYSDLFLTKEPHTEGVFSMHQDRWGWTLEPMELVNVWLAFTDSTPDNGCLTVIPGSHLSGELPHELRKTPENVISYGQTVTCVDAASAVPMPLAAGEMSLHDVGLVHASGPNRTADRRIGYAMRYIAPHVRPGKGPPNTVSVVRGEDRYRHWDHEPRPAQPFDPACAQAHSRLLEIHAPSGYVYL